MSQPLTQAELPLTAPEPCPICGAKVTISDVSAARNLKGLDHEINAPQ